MMDIYGSVGQLYGVGPKKLEALSKLGIETVYDLLTYFPRDYRDFTKVYSIKDAPLGVEVCVRAYVGSIARERPIRKGLTTYTLDATDGESIMDLTFFNNKYLAQSLKTDTEYIFFGKMSVYGRGLRSMASPQVTAVSDSSPGLRPVYPQSASINSNYIEKLVKTALDKCGELEDCLPVEIRNAYCLMSFDECIRNLHFPKSEDMLSEAKRRYSFEELFDLQVGLSRLKEKSRKNSPAVLKTDYTEEFIAKLPFELTGAQKRAIKECSADMSGGITMNRLLQGDVGSGKTAVAAAVIYNCVKNGFQAALMAPTEVLAGQHYATFNSFFENTGIKTALLTGSVSKKDKQKIKERLKNGEIDLIIGTHALIQKDVEFASLGLAVTDEQHRFGVSQRALLNSKGKSPHVLVMSATPIPRTLSFIIYGELDLSILDEMPKGRQKIETYLITRDKRERAYGYVKKHLIEGRQAYIICPLIDSEDDADSEVAASKQLYKELSEGFFMGFKPGLLYGKMKPQEKRDVMDGFARGDIDVLISTTVVEVGVDVPNAVIMVIENAEMFGLSQLHQLRGRVGRGEYKSTCILISDKADSENSERLRILTETTDGFKIADEDLRLRGPGDMFGSRQHGLPNMKIAGMLKDSEVVRETHFAAEKLLKDNPELIGEEYDLLKKSVNRMFMRGISLN